MRKFTFTLFAALLLLLVTGAQAQTSGSLTGSVTDPQGAVIAGANVTVRHNETGAERTGTSSDKGGFTFTELQPGTYTVTVTANGFKKSVAPNITVQVSKGAEMSVALEVGGIGETVTVTDSQDVINTTNPSLTNVIDTRQVMDLPMAGRNPLDLAALQAGIAVVGNDTRGASVSGLRQTAVNVTQDGINAMDNFVKTSSFFAIATPSLNSTAEFSITTGTVGSDAGRGAAQVNMVTRGGSNDYHGGAFAQFINEGYNANTFINNMNGAAIPMLHQHYFGGDIGGPVHFLNFGEGVDKHFNGKDRAFFFFSFEAFRQIQAATRNRSGVLTQQARAGTFRYNDNAGVLRTIDLLSQASVPFHGLNPIMTAHLALIPLPNNNNCPANDGFNIACYTFNVSENSTRNSYVARYDHQLVNNTWLGSHKFEFVMNRVVTSTSPDVFTNGVEAPFPGGINALQYSTRNLVTPALVSTFGSNITNTLRYGRQWAPVVFDRDSPPTADFLSLPGVLVNYDNANMPQPRNTIVNQVTDNLSWVHGNHLFKFGGDWQNVLVNSFNSAGINKTIQLSGTDAANGTGLTLVNFPGLTNNSVGNAIVAAAQTNYAAIVGLLGSASQTLNVTTPTSGFVPGATRFRNFQEKDLALYAQDQWRFRSNITINAGVRWDYMGVPTVPSGLAIQPKYSDLFGVSGFGNLFKPTAPGGVPPAVATQQFVSGDTGIGLFNNDMNNFAPFFGVAYSPKFKSGVGHFLFGDEGKSSIRAGYSISYLHDGLTTISNALGTGTTNPGLIQTANLSVLSCTNPPPPGGCVPTANLLGQLGPGGVPLITPSFIMPISDRQNILANVNNGLWGIDPNLRSPYVQQWNIGFEREVWNGMALEVRYVGNRAVKTWRAVDFNEINIFENGFLTEFKNAQNNLVARGGASFAPGCGTTATGTCVATPLLDKLFAGLAAGSGYSSSAFVGNLNGNNVGGMAFTLALSGTYRANRESTTNPIPANLFMANPNANFAIGLTNDSFSNYNALEIELRRRYANGFQFQADYTWSKAMGNAVDAQGNNQSDLVRFLTLRNKQADYRRSTQDQTQRFVANGIYDLPFGKGRHFLDSSNGVVDRIVGGWTIGAIATWASGVPFFVTSGRTTVTGSATNNGAQLTGISYDDFKNNVGIFKTPGGVLFINPAILDITYCTAAQIVAKQCTQEGRIFTSKLKAGLMSSPAPGSFGNFPVNALSGPSYFNVDLSITKRIPITERVRLEFKVTAINFLNHANFVYATQNFDATNFGVITAQRGTARNMNFLGQIRF